ncbi:NTP transferase domain-containing protein [Bdellovibrionota bacterium FG-2]
MQCVVLAGGLATRMRPMTETIPKALIEVEGRPFVDWQLEYLVDQGITEVVFSIGYRGEMLREHLDRYAPRGLKIVFVDEGENLRGTGGALRLAFDEGVLQERFFVLYGDSYLPVDFGAVWECFLKSRARALMTVFQNQGQWDTSNVVFREGKLELYDKKRRTRADEMSHIDYGLSVFARDTIASGMAPLVPGAKSDLADLFYQLSVSGELCGFEVTERFYEIGSHEGLAEFSRYLRTKNTRGES